ncbi:hypothetical protein [Paraurantiacibacter namhicola]|uniref:Uncharacterized protein n=1 Tax=Paraurantiacibacter namhicola TaxID=645517 RepID=A0A1C7D9S8_9SPHN|nr:hypothetical protein [Paraurantiacibacter namhicola]ANU08240.1 hypothetical protein A6F65_01948 [Paraurantiacibacter namhicola]
MRRALVLTDESARHPFRASLPAYVCKDTRRRHRAWRVPFAVNAEDVRGFALAYSACFVAVMTFIW